MDRRHVLVFVIVTIAALAILCMQLYLTFAQRHGSAAQNELSQKTQHVVEELQDSLHSQP